MTGVAAALSGKTVTARNEARIGSFLAWGLVAPALIFFVIWNVLPLIWMVGLSFYRYSLVSGLPPRFIGLQHYVNMLSSGIIWRRLTLTLGFLVLAVGVETLLGCLLGVAFWNSQKLPGRRIALTLMFAPMILAPVAVGTFFRLIYNPIFGILTFYVRALSGVTLNPLGNGATALPAVLVVDIWMWTPFMLLMTLAALGAVPRAALEAAEVDQLTWLQTMRQIVWPYGKFILMLGVLLRTIDAFKTFDLVSAMTEGGPGSATELVSLTLYRRAFTDFTMGNASALAVIVLIIAIAFTSLYLYVLHFSRRRAG